MKLEQAIQELRKQEKKKFTQTIDLGMTLKNIDVKKPENRFSKETVLPHGRGRDVQVGVISDSVPDAINRAGLDELQQDMKKMRAVINKYDYFLCEPALMATVGKVLGKFLGPKGKMPKPLPPNVPAEAIMKGLKKSVTVRVRDAPAINVPVGNEAMTDEQIKENAEAVINDVKALLPKGANQIKTLYIKTTMGKPVRIDA
ncbi:MAG TPA: 50S ribosomal protein L1 [archaeon]|nr:50S ribosomal protein L1 [archaeon]